MVGFRVAEAIEIYRYFNGLVYFRHVFDEYLTTLVGKSISCPQGQSGALSRQAALLTPRRVLLPRKNAAF
jgi:glycerol-3-phosphate O-acyltransferase